MMYSPRATNSSANEHSTANNGEHSATAASVLKATLRFEQDTPTTSNVIYRRWGTRNPNRKRLVIAEMEYSRRLDQKKE